MTAQQILIEEQKETRYKKKNKNKKTCGVDEQKMGLYVWRG